MNETDGAILSGVRKGRVSDEVKELSRWAVDRFS
jgi:hypothetical protein